MKRTLLAVFLLMFSASVCFSGAHEFSEWKEEEKVELKLVPKSEEKFDPLLTPLLATGGAVVIKKGFAYFKESEKKKLEKYVASYGQKETDTNFFQISGQDLDKIQLTRWASKGRGVEKASFVSLNLRKDPSGAFTFTLDDVWVRYSSCKIEDKKSFKGRLSYPQIDLTVKVSIQCFWRDSTGAPRSDSLGTLEIPIKKVFVTGWQRLATGRLKLCKALCEDGDNQEQCTKNCDDESKKEKNAIHSWFPPLPINYVHPNQGDNVMYLLSVTVVEYDDYAELMKKYGAFVGDSADMTEALAQKLLGLLTAKP